MIENWRPIVGHDGYEVSDLGRVRGPHGVFRAWKLYTGYMQIKIARKAHSVHRLVAAAFCSGWFPGAVVNHKNGVRDDNRVENLEWVSHSENLKHGFRVLGAKTPFKGKFSGQHNTSKPVISTCVRTGDERRYEAAMDAVREGFDSGGISHCYNGRQRTHGGRIWRYARAKDVRWSPTSLGGGER